MGQCDLVDTIARALGMVPASGTLFQRTEAIKAYLHKNPGFLIIVDEADKLISKNTQKRMEILRKFVKDNRFKADVGMVLAGEPQLITLLKNYDDRLDSRGTCWYQLNGLSNKEAEEYLARVPMDEGARETLISRACDTRRGCFRRLDQTLDNVVRLMRDKGMQRVTAEILAETKLILERIERNPDIDPAKAAQAIMTNGLLQRMSTTDEEYFEMPLDKAGRLLASFRRVNIAERKVQFNMREKAELAFEQMEGQLMDAIKHDPVLAPQLHEILAKAKELIENEQQAS